MTDGTSIAGQADAIASRLRMRQVDFADDAPESRRSFLEKEIRDCLAKLRPAERQPFLEALSERFPGFSDVQVPQRPAAAEVAPDVPKDPLTLARELAAQASTMEAGEREAVMETLRAANLVPQGKVQVPEQLAKLLQLQPNETLDGARLMQALALFAEVLTRLDNAVWKPWSQIAPDSPIKQGAVLKTALAKYLRGESVDLGKYSVEMMKLAAALMTAMTRVARSLFDEQIAPLMPSTISGNHGGPLGPWKCWEEYKTLAASMNAPGFESDFYRKIERIVNDVW